MSYPAGARLRIAVKIDDSAGTIRITVLGHVTPESLRVLSVITRRSAALLPGRDIVLDLMNARTAPAVITELDNPDHLMTLAADSGNPGQPWPLRILTPERTQT